jgi:hypothetical protein
MHFTEQQLNSVNTSLFATDGKETQEANFEHILLETTL